MDEYKQILETLCEQKKIKKEPNLAEKNEYKSAWTALVNSEGFSDEAEKYLYAGYSYYVVEAFKNYLNNAEDRKELLTKFQRGKLFSDNCGTTSSMMFHLLALTINDDKEDHELLIWIIQRIPNVLINKENKIYGQAGRALKKYLIDVLNDNAVITKIIELEDNGLPKESAKRFVQSMDTALSQIETYNMSRKSIENYRRVNTWLHPETSGERIFSPEETDIFKANKTGSNFQEQDVTTIDYDKDPGAEQIKKLNKKIEYQAGEINMMREHYNRSQAALEREKSASAAKDELIKNISEQSEEQRRIINNLEQTLNKMKEALSSRDEMVGILRKDREKATDEGLRRAASRLRTYHEDYLDAKNIEMSIELGENLRDQLGEVFAILSETGLNF